MHVVSVAPFGLDHDWMLLSRRCSSILVDLLERSTLNGEGVTEACCLIHGVRSANHLPDLTGHVCAERELIISILYCDRGSILLLYKGGSLSTCTLSFGMAMAAPIGHNRIWHIRYEVC